PPRGGGAVVVCPGPVLLAVGTLARAVITPLQTLMIPASVIAGILGLALGPNGLGWLPFSSQLGT
ncbi:hypothetical protein M3A84_004605, partial [Micrococcus luteus]|nr:hypothetical protein [Micrococcus luteus]